MAFTLQQRPTTQYRGRFAPSPSGFLHFGSLVAALASYLDAKANDGLWLVRIEDIDPPRELEGASKNILKTLEAYGLFWDETELYQSQQTQLYEDVLADLHQQRLTYYCECTRAQIKAIGGIYQGHCRNRQLVSNQTAIRLVNQFNIDHFDDIIQGHVQCDKALAEEDFIIKRKDGLYAYQLAVVVDDIYQGINHVIRGCDLLEPTARQLTFFNTLNAKTPKYGHFPLAVTDEGYKLSKQNKAPAIDPITPQPSLLKALHFLGQCPPPALLDTSVTDILDWAIKHWQRKHIPQKKEITL